MTTDKSCLAVAAFMTQLRLHHCTPATVVKSTSNARCCVVWDVLKAASVSVRFSPADILLAVNDLLGGTLHGPMLVLARELIRQSDFVIAQAERRVSGSSVQRNKMLKHWDHTPTHALDRWMNLNPLRSSAPLWVSLVYGSTSQMSTKRKYITKTSVPIEKNVSCILLSLVHEQQCAATVLEQFSNDCISLKTYMSTSTVAINAAVNNVRNNQMERRLPQDVFSPIERLEYLVKHNVDNHSTALKLMKNHDCFDKAIHALGTWLLIDSTACILHANQNRKSIYKGTLSILGRLAVLGHPQSSVVIARLAAECTALGEMDAPDVSHPDSNSCLATMVDTLNSALVNAKYFDDILVELNRKPVYQTDIETRIGDEIAHTCVTLSGATDQIEDLIDLMQSVVASLPPEVSSQVSSDFLPATLSQNRKVVQELHLSSVAIQELHNFRHIIMSDCQSHGLVSAPSVPSAISKTFANLVESTRDVQMDMSCTYEILNKYTANVMRMALFMAPDLTPGRVVSLHAAGSEIHGTYISHIPENDD
jgi:hypothetical protein